jgi:hypothetical protein
VRGSYHLSVAGSPFLATDPAFPTFREVMASRINVTCKARIPKPSIAAAVAIATCITAALGPVVAESRRPYL